MRTIPRFRALAVAALLPLVTSCVSITEHTRALIYHTEGIAVRSLDCVEAVRTADERRLQATAIDASAIRLLTWNIHKQEDAGWDRDLARFAAASDILLLQEVTLTDPIERIL